MQTFPIVLDLSDAFFEGAAHFIELVVRFTKRSSYLFLLSKPLFYIRKYFVIVGSPDPDSFRLKLNATQSLFINTW